MKKTITIIMGMILLMTSVVLAEDFYFYQPDYPTCTSNEGNMYFYGCSGAYENFTGVGIDFTEINYQITTYGCDGGAGFLYTWQGSIDFQPTWTVCIEGTPCIYVGNQSWQNELTQFYNICGNNYPRQFLPEGFFQRITTCNQDNDCPSCQYCNEGTCEFQTDTDLKNDCSLCQVCDGTGSCNPENNGTDIKDECSGLFCDGTGSCNIYTPTPTLQYTEPNDLTGAVIDNGTKIIVGFGSIALLLGLLVGGAVVVFAFNKLIIKK